MYVSMSISVICSHRKKKTGIDITHINSFYVLNSCTSLLSTYDPTKLNAYQAFSLAAQSFFSVQIVNNIGHNSSVRHDSHYLNIYLPGQSLKNTWRNILARVNKSVKCSMFWLSTVMLHTNLEFIRSALIGTPFFYSKQNVKNIFLMGMI